MDCVGISAAALKTGCFFMGASSPARYLHHSSSFNYQAEEAWALERGAGLVGGDEFFVDDLLDFGGVAEEEQGEEGEESEPRSKEEKDGEENGSNSASKSGVSCEELAAAEPLVPVGDICDLEWVSHFVDDSILDIPCSALSASPFRPIICAPKPAEPKFHILSPTANVASHCRSPSTVSISSAVSPGASAISSCMKRRTWSCFSDNPVEVPSKARSKRSRRSGHMWSSQPHFPEPLCSSSLSSSSSSCSATSSLSSCLPVECYYPDAVFKSIVPTPRGRGRPPLHKRATMFTDLAEDLKKHRKTKGRKPKTAAGPALLSMPSSAQEGSCGAGARVCSHCGVSKTPQWRAGPMGSKTLCNACGVRFKSGRLLPEYRPASSPTFVSDVHSNSHRKVLEMRRKKELTQPQHQLFSFESDYSGDSIGQSCSDSSETPAADTDGFLAPPATPHAAEAVVF